MSIFLIFRPACRLVVLIAAVSVFSGANCTKTCVLSPNAQSPEILQVLNTNSQVIDSMITNDVKIRGRTDGRFFMVKASLAMQKPRRFRLVARSGFGSEELDMGSNENTFWFWIARGDPPTLYYCDHPEKAGTGTGRALSLDPEWIIEALGVSEIDPDDIHEGPYTTSGGRISLVTRSLSSRGEQVSKVMLIDPCMGQVVEQQLKDARGRVLARARFSDHQRDPNFGVLLPKTIDLEWPQMDLSLTMTLDNVRINQIFDRSLTDRWTKPDKDREEELCETNPRVSKAQSIGG